VLPVYYMLVIASWYCWAGNCWFIIHGDHILTLKMLAYWVTKNFTTFFFAFYWQLSLYFYVRKQLLLSVHLSHRNSVRPSVCLSVTRGGSVKSGAS